MEISQSERKFALAALEVFKRFGVRKATMEEIAQEAGVSKPTLYATYRNKDAALGGSIRIAKAHALQDVKEAWKSSTCLSEKLDLFFERMVVAGFDMLHSTPDPTALENAIGEASEAAINEAQALEITAMYDVLEENQGAHNSELALSDFAKFVVTAAMNAKRQATSRNDLSEFLATLKQTILIAMR